jgi:uncharacterized RDD family membrane protein YckC
VIDAVIILLPILLLALCIVVLGVLTLGFGFLLFWLLWPLSVIWALLYIGMTLGGPESATLGMRLVDLEMRTWYGAPMYFLLADVHAILFWLTMSMLTPVILVLALLNRRGRLLHDFLTGTQMVNNELRASALRTAYARWNPNAGGPL